MTNDSASKQIKKCCFKKNWYCCREGLKLIIGEVSEDILNELVNEADVNQDGEITYDEFEALLMTS